MLSSVCQSHKIFANLLKSYTCRIKGWAKLQRIMSSNDDVYPCSRRPVAQLRLCW